MNPPDIETGSENYPGNKSWRRVTRAELYAKVWSEPMVKIAKEFGISDRGLAKTCKRLEVPVPPRGYWAKLQAGKEVSKLPLPAAKPMTTTETVIHRTPLPRVVLGPPAARDPELQKKIDAALALCVPVRVPKSLSNPHPVIRGWMNEDQRARERARENIYAPPHLSITRTGTDRRRLRILTTIFREFERMGYLVAAQRENREPVSIRSATAELKFIVFEPIRRVRIQLTDKEKQDSWNKNREWKHERHLSGELLLRIESNCGGGTKSEWKDEPESSLENQIDELMTGLKTAMVLVEDLERQRREEQTRRWKLEQERAELERLRQIEAARWKHILELATASGQAAAVREFLDRIERRTQWEPVDPGLSEKYAEWIGWARSRADQTDPLVRPLTELQLEPEASRASTLWR